SAADAFFERLFVALYELFERRLELRLGGREVEVGGQRGCDRADLAFERGGRFFGLFLRCAFELRRFLLDLFQFRRDLLEARLGRADRARRQRQRLQRFDLLVDFGARLADFRFRLFRARFTARGERNRYHAQQQREANEG